MINELQIPPKSETTGAWDAQIIADIEAGKFDHIRDEALRIPTDIEDLVDDLTDVVIACDPKHADLLGAYLSELGIGYGCGQSKKGLFALMIETDLNASPAASSTEVK